MSDRKSAVCCKTFLRIRRTDGLKMFVQFFIDTDWIPLQAGLCENEIIFHYHIYNDLPSTQKAVFILSFPHRSLMGCGAAALTGCFLLLLLHEILKPSLIL